MSSVIKMSAVLSDDEQRTYRYVLWRKWAKDPDVMFIGLNPSTADHEQDDPTIRRCIGYARMWGFGGLAMCNLFAYRSTDPKVLKDKPIDEVIGPDNDLWIIETAQYSDKIVAMWGNHGSLYDRDVEVARIVGRHSKMWCFGYTKHDHPTHPLRLPYDNGLKLYIPRED